MFFVYFLKSKNFDYNYVGFTNNLERRLKQHNNKKVISTKHYAPYVLIKHETYMARKEALDRENHLKSNKGYLERKGIFNGGVA